MDRALTERYQRQLVLPDFGVEGQEKLMKSRVLIIGAGGLGVPVMQYLAGMGLGTIGLMDGDVVSLSNLHRQVLYTTADVGQLKVTVAKQRLELLNPTIQILPFPEMLTTENASSVCAQFDLIVDCTDSIDARYLINDACVELGLPFVYGALYRHEGQVSVFNFKGSSTYRDAFPDDSMKVENCNEIGVLGVLPAIVGSYQALEAVKVLTGFGESLAGKLLVIDAANMEHHLFYLSEKKQATKKHSPKQNWLTWQELNTLDNSNYHWLDVREMSSYTKSHDERFAHVPMSDLAGFAPATEKDFVLVCQQGKSTQQAAAILQAMFPDRTIYQVKGGYNAL